MGWQPSVNCQVSLNCDVSFGKEPYCGRSLWTNGEWNTIIFAGEFSRALYLRCRHCWFCEKKRKDHVDSVDFFDKGFFWFCAYGILKGSSVSTGNITHRVLWGPPWRLMNAIYKRLLSFFSFIIQNYTLSGQGNSMAFCECDLQKITSHSFYNSLSKITHWVLLGAPG